MEESNTNSFNYIYPFWNLLKDIVLLVDESGQLEFANHAYFKFNGLTMQDIQFKPIPWCNLDWDDLLEMVEKSPNRMVFFDINGGIPNINETLQFVQKLKNNEKNFYLFQQIKISQEMRISDTLLNSTDISFIYVDKDYLIKSFNNAANLLSIKVFGKDLLLGISILDLINEIEGFEEMLEHLKSAFSGKYIVFTHEFQTREQASVWQEFQIHPISGGDSPVTEAAIVIRDITKFKNSENEIKKSEEIFRNTFTNITDPALLWQQKPGGEIALLTYNLAAGNLSKGKFENWIGSPVEKFYEGQTIVQNLIKEVFSTGIKKSLETNFQLIADEEEKWVASDYIKISDEYLLNVLKDITERKKADIALAEKQRQYETLLKNLPGMVYRCRNDKEWTMEFVNEGCYGLLGYSPEDLINNKTIAFAQLIHPEDLDSVWKNIQANLNQHCSYEINYRIITSKNETKWVWERGQGLYNDQGEITALEGFITDITERLLFEQKAEKARQQAEALQEAMAELASQLDLSQVLRRILVTLKKVLDYDSATLFLKINDNLKVVAARGFENTSRLIDKTFPADNELLSEIQKLNEPLILSDAQNDPRFIRWEAANRVRGWMGVPLIRHGQFIGFMTIDNHQPSAYSTEDAVIAQTFADEAAIVIENAKLYERAQLLATSDGLTGIYNRRYFFEVSKKEFERSQRYGSALSVIMIDIDHFKYINDRYGHSAGDQVLMQFVERVKNELRSTDVLARYGGEEFVILLLESDLAEAIQVAERIREVTARDPFELQEAKPYITISLGVATNEEDVQFLDNLIDRSDKALYESKQFGRNRVRAFHKN
ncbi:MAG: hypothetical protein CVU46_07640 [Chloroflexi bacterium HGW-Chloroflexi-8]|nr:MAG: hypothetical protein CVU46_07640 [Chloroflexi bacterium HGW-Chloroflexi-8]